MTSKVDRLIANRVNFDVFDLGEISTGNHDALLRIRNGHTPSAGVATGDMQSVSVLPASGVEHGVARAAHPKRLALFA